MLMFWFMSITGNKFRNEYHLSIVVSHVRSILSYDVLISKRFHTINLSCSYVSVSTVKRRHNINNEYYFGNNDNKRNIYIIWNKGSYLHSYIPEVVMCCYNSHSRCLLRRVCNTFLSVVNVKPIAQSTTSCMLQSR